MSQGCFAPPGYATQGGDCNDGDGSAWSVPGETQNLRFTGTTSIAWDPPAQPGGVPLTYSLIRSTVRSDFVNNAVCVDLGEFGGPPATDPEAPPVGSVFYYLSRLSNNCPGGQGSLGTSSDGTPRSGRTCP